MKSFHHFLHQFHSPITFDKCHPLYIYIEQRFSILHRDIQWIPILLELFGTRISKLHNIRNIVLVMHTIDFNFITKFEKIFTAFVCRDTNG